MMRSNETVNQHIPFNKTITSKLTVIDSHLSQNIDACKEPQGQDNKSQDCKGQTDTYDHWTLRSIVTCNTHCDGKMMNE
jgi:hypothetical protein